MVIGILDPGPMDLTGIGDKDGVREAAREHAIRSRMPKEFAVTYAQGRVDAFDQVETSLDEALDFARGYAEAMSRHPHQQSQQASVPFADGYDRALIRLEGMCNPSAAKAYAYGYAEGIASIPSSTLTNPQSHPAGLLRTSANSLHFSEGTGEDKPLHTIARTGGPEAIRSEWEMGHRIKRWYPNIDIPNENGGTALQLAARSNSNPESIKTLVVLGASLKVGTPNLTPCDLANINPNLSPIDKATVLAYLCPP